jgi:hypothetical protein
LHRRSMISPARSAVSSERTLQPLTPEIVSRVVV